MHKVLLQTREAKHPPAKKFIVFKVGGKHPPANDFTTGALPWVPPWNKSNKNLLLPHLKQHGTKPCSPASETPRVLFITYNNMGSKNLSMECTFASLTRQRKKTSQGYAGFWDSR